MISLPCGAYRKCQIIFDIHDNTHEFVQTRKRECYDIWYVKRQSDFYVDVCCAGFAS